MCVWERSLADGDSCVTNNNAVGVKAQLAAQIVDVLKTRSLTVRTAGALATTPPADISRIRSGKLERFTVDRLIAILSKLDQNLEISLDIRPSVRQSASYRRRS